MSILIDQLRYEHPNREPLFSNISLSIQKGVKATLIGDNGIGKSTILKILAGELLPTSGLFRTDSAPYYIPQHFGQYDNIFIYEAIGVAKKIEAFHAILDGEVTEDNFKRLNEDWHIEEKVTMALAQWKLDHINPIDRMQSLSGGEKTKVFLAGVSIHKPQIVLMDEPSNHLDYESRELLYNFILSHTATMLIVSHDKSILNLATHTYELSKLGAKYYAGNYTFYKEVKEVETAATLNRLEDKEKELRFARKTKQEIVEKRQKLDARGRQRGIKKGLGKMALNILKDRAEKTSSKLKDVHEGKVDSTRDDIADIQEEIDQSKIMKVNFNSSKLHRGKILAKATNLNYKYAEDELWAKSLSFVIQSGQRILLKGLNGAGKTTLLNMLTKRLQPALGELILAEFSYVHLDQEYSMIDNTLSVYEQAKRYAPKMLEHDVKMNLSRYLFLHYTWDKSCSVLSGGEKMKLALCCLMLDSSQPDMIILDEPTNNIDLKNINVLVASIKDYEGTIILVSHDDSFIHEIGIDYDIELK